MQIQNTFNEAKDISSVLVLMCSAAMAAVISLPFPPPDVYNPRKQSKFSNSTCSGYKRP